MPTYSRPLLYAFPIVLFASLIEAVVMARSRPGQYDWRASGVSVLDLVGRHFLTLLPLSLAAPLFTYAWKHRIYTVSMTSIVAVIVLFLGQEFFYYWYHRAAHRVSWFWATHAVHHSSNQLNLSSAYRLGWTGKLTGTAMFFTPLVWLGLRPEIVQMTITLNLLYQFWIHATWIPRLGWLEYLLNTPSAHRVHHASNLEYLDANYGGVLIVFDRLFGTYVAERNGEPCRYGWVKPIENHNPLQIEFTVWKQIIRNVLGARNISEVLGYLLLPPGWRPGGTGETTENLRNRRDAKHTASSTNSEAARTVTTSARPR